MNRIWKILFSLLPVFSLAACSSRELQQIDSSAIPSSSSTERIKPIPVASSSSPNPETLVSSSSTQTDIPPLKNDA